MPKSRLLRLSSGLLLVLAVVFTAFFLFTLFCFLAVKKLPLTKAGLGIFRRFLVSDSLSGIFYQGVTARILGLFPGKSGVDSPYPDYLFPVSGELYSGRFLYAGRPEICGEATSADRVCLKFKSGRVLKPLFINGVSVWLKGGQVLSPALSRRSGSGLPVGTEVEVFLHSDTSPRQLLKGQGASNPYFDIREIRVLAESAD